jgi:hypothetical protein
MKNKQTIFIIIVIVVAVIGFVFIRGQLSKKQVEMEKRKQLIENMKKKERALVDATFPGASTPGAPVSLEKEAVEGTLARLFVKNVSARAIESFEAQIFCYDARGNPVKEKFTGAPYMGVFYREKIAPLGSVGKNCAWRLKGFKGTRKIRINVNKVTFSDGTEWTGNAIVER